MAHQLEPGDPAPSFTLRTQSGEDWSLDAALRRGPVVLFFYPKDETPVCTAEVCQFRDQHEIFVEHGAEVVGISSDDVRSHERFASRHHLPYTLLADPDGSVRAKFGVKKTLGLFDGRVTFIIGPDGRIAHVHRSSLNAGSHVREALSALDRVAVAG